MGDRPKGQRSVFLQDKIIRLGNVSARVHVRNVCPHELVHDNSSIRLHLGSSHKFDARDDTNSKDYQVTWNFLPVSQNNPANDTVEAVNALDASYQNDLMSPAQTAIGERTAIRAQIDQQRAQLSDTALASLNHRKA